MEKTTIVCDCHSTGSFFTWLLVIAGWYIVNRQHNNREKRREIRTQLDQFNEMLKETEALAIKYHTADTHDIELSRKLKRNIEHIGQVGRRLNLIEMKKYSHLNIQLRQAITLKNFDSGSKFEKQSENSDIVASICNATDKFTYSMEQGFIKEYH